MTPMSQPDAQSQTGRRRAQERAFLGQTPREGGAGWGSALGTPRTERAEVPSQRGSSAGCWRPRKPGARSRAEQGARSGALRQLNTLRVWRAPAPRSRAAVRTAQRGWSVDSFCFLGWGGGKSQFWISLFGWPWRQPPKLSK